MEIVVKPSDVWFTVTIVDNLFHRSSHHSYSPIGETLDLLCEGKIKIRDVPLIAVVKQGNKWLTVNNRRLWIFREMERLGKCVTIPVRAVEENLFPSDCCGFMKAKVRENPGGLWYLLPSCEMEDPFNNVIWDTVNHIKENMFPPPSRRIIVTIFQNLSRTKLNRLGYAGEDGSRSEAKTLSSGYLDVKKGEFGVAQIDIIENRRRIEQWVVDQTISTEDSNVNSTIKTFVLKILGKQLGVPRCYYSVPSSLRFNVHDEDDRVSVTSTMSVQGSLPFDASERVEMLSAASCSTSGYLFVTGNPDDNIEKDRSVESSENQSATSEAKPDGNQQNELRLIPEGIEESSLEDIAREITDGVSSMLSQGQTLTEFNEKAPEIHSFILSCLQRTGSLHNQKCKTYESEIDSLKSDIESIISSKNEEIQKLTHQAAMAEINLQQMKKFISTFVRSKPQGTAENTQMSQDPDTSKTEDKVNITFETSHVQCDVGLSVSEVSTLALSNCIGTADCATNVLETDVHVTCSDSNAHVENWENISEANNSEHMSVEFVLTDYQSQEDINAFALGLWQLESIMSS